MAENSHSRLSFFAEYELDPTNRNCKKRKHCTSKSKKKLVDPVDFVNLHSKIEAPFENRQACNGFELDASGGGACTKRVYV